VVDTSDLPFQGVDTILHARFIHMLIDLGNVEELTNPEIEDFIRDNTEDYYGDFGEGIIRFYIDKWVVLQDYESTDDINPLLVYKISYLIFIVVLIQVALGLPIILTSVRRKEQYYYGLLMSRGFGKKGIFRFILGELFVINFLAIFGGVAIGLLSSTLTLLIGHATNPYAIGHQFRLFLNPVDIIAILVSALGLSLLIFLVDFLSSTRKSISEYLTKF
ncbi:MAG: FtsX-like permease family protein, partial [Promethearchaeota archaeon]